MNDLMIHNHKTSGIIQGRDKAKKPQKTVIEPSLKKKLVQKLENMP